MASLLDLEKKLRNLFNQGGQTVGKLAQNFNQPLKSSQNRPTNTGFKPWDNFANNTFKPAARTFGNAAINQVKNDVSKGLPAAVRIAAPAYGMIQDRQQGRNWLQSQQRIGMDYFNSAKLGSYALGAPRLATKAGAIALTSSGALGGGLNKLMGGSFLEGAGQGVGMTPSILGITGLTNPLIEKGVSRFAPQINNTIGKFIAPRITRGVLNVPEGALIDSSLGRRPLSPESAAMDFLTGLLPGSPNTRAKVKGLKGVNPKAFDLHPQDADELARIGQILLKSKGERILDINQQATLARTFKYLFPGYNLDTMSNKKVAQVIGATLDRYNKIPKDVTTPFPSMGMVDNGVFKPPYKKGDITELKKYESALLGDKSSRSVNNISKRAELEYYAKQGDPDAKAQLEALEIVENNIIKAQEAKSATQKVIPLKQNTPQTQEPIMGNVQQGANALTSDAGGYTKPVSQLQQKTQSGVVQSNPLQTSYRDKKQSIQSPSEDIISEAKKQIGKYSDMKDKRSLRQVADTFYTNWIDRYHPLNKLATEAEKQGKKAGFEIRPEYNPKFTTRRFLGMGGIAEQRYDKELKPIIDELDSLKIDKSDMDVYMKAKREVGFGQVQRDIYGSDPVKAKQIVDALEQKYGESIKPVAQKLYEYQNKGYQELVDAGFISRQDAPKVQAQNPNYVPFTRKMDDEMDQFLGIPTKVAQQKVNPVKGIKGSDKQVLSPIESVIANTFRHRAAIEKNNVAKSIVGLQKAIPGLTFNKATKEGKDTITVWENGQRSYYEVGEEISSSVRGMNEETINGFLKVLTVPSSILRQGATGRNPDFMLPNIVRDQFDAAINSKYGYVPVLDYIRGFSHVIKQDEVYQKWLKSGASMNFSELSGRKSVQRLFDEKKARGNLFSWMGKRLDFLGKYSEQPTRVGLFNKALKKTGNETLAMMESRDSTLDFSRMGAKMKVANSIIPFLNVGVQGFDKLVRGAKDNPGKFALKMGMYGAVPTTMVSLYNNLYHPEEYAEIPHYIKETNFVFVNGRNEDGTVDYVTIPKGNVITYAANPIDNFISYLNKTNKQSFGEMASYFLSSSLPILGEGSSPKEVAIKTIGSNLPQAIKPITENLINKSFFKYDSKKEESKEIVPYYLKDEAPGDRAYKFTPTAYKLIGKTLNVSPLQVQNAAEGYLAGYTKIPVNIMESIIKVGNGESVDSNQIPILRRFMQHTYPTSGSSSTGKTGAESVEIKQKEEKPLIAQAGATSGTEISWVDSKTKRKNTIKLTGEKVDNNNLTGADKYKQNIENKTAWSTVDKIFDSPLSTTEKKKYLKDVGVTYEDAIYYDIAKKNTDQKTVHVIKALSKLPEDKILDKLEFYRKSINDKQILSDSVIDNLVDEGLIDKAQGKALKAMDYNKDGTLKKSAAKGKKKGMKLSIAKIAPVKTNTSPLKLSKPKQVKSSSGTFKLSARKPVKLAKFKAKKINTRFSSKPTLTR